MSDGLLSPSRLPVDGFIHAAPSFAVALKVAGSYFRNAGSPVVVLELDVGKLGSPCRLEAPAPLAGGSDHRTDVPLFPHVYGPIRLQSVTRLHLLDERDGVFSARPI